MFWKISAYVLLSTALISGCGKDDDHGIPVANPPTTQLTVNPVLMRHTPEELKNGPRTALNVIFAPITLQVPPGWEVKTYGDSVHTIEGQTPDDVVGISIPISQQISSKDEANMEAEAGKDFLAHPDLLQGAGVKDIAGGKLIERFTIENPTTQLAGAATTEPVQTVRWTFTICVPSSDGKEFTAYELRYLGLTLKQFNADHEFLRGIMNTLTYIPAPTGTLTN